MDIEEQFGGRGRAVITASSAMEYAFEGDELADAREQVPSVFTNALVEGLETGEADRDQDGMVALDELYDYVYDKVRAVTPNQTPGKWTFGVQGELVIARRSRPVTTPAPLPPELQEAADSPFAGVRAGVVPELARLLRSRHAGLALAARLTLERLADDDSRATSATAVAALAAGAAAEPTAPEPASKPAQPEPATEPPPTPKVAATTTRAATTTPAPTGPVAEPPGDAPGLAAPAGTGVAAQRAATAAPAESRTRAAAAEPSTGKAPPAAEDRTFHVAGWLAVVGAVLMGFGLLLPFQWSSNLIDDQDTLALGFALTAAFGLGAGIGILRQATARLAGPGLLIGVAAASTRALVQLLTEQLRDAGGYGAGFWVEVGAHVVLLAAGCVAVVALARSGDVRLDPQALRTRSSQLIVLLGVAGTVALLVVDRRILNLGAEWYWSISTIWLTVLALLVPPAAAIALPRRFGTWLLAGWIAGAGAVVADYSIWNARQVS
ncbi:MAG TPA: hypothetical protein VGA45_20200, partial [Actinomycetota bacterium]